MRRTLRSGTIRAIGEATRPLTGDEPRHVGGGAIGRSLRQYPLVTFFLLAFAITWVVWVPRAVEAPMGVVGQVSTWAPAIAALLAAALTGGRGAVRELGARLVRWRVGWQWYVVVIIGPAVFSLAVAVISALLGGSWTAAVPLALREGPFVLLPLFLMVLALTDGLGEELAWRGFALPRLLASHNALLASLILGVLWMLWHLPLVWTESAVLYQPVRRLAGGSGGRSPDTTTARRGREVGPGWRSDRGSRTRSGKGSATRDSTQRLTAPCRRAQPLCMASHQLSAVSKNKS